MEELGHKWKNTLLLCNSIKVDAVLVNAVHVYAFLMLYL